MDSNLARKLYYQHANAMAYIDVLKPDGARGIGSAFHIGDGIFVTARHVVDGNEILEVKISEPIAIRSREFFSQAVNSNMENFDERIKEYDETMKEIMGHDPLFKHWLDPLDIEIGPVFYHDDRMDVAAFKVKKIHSGAGIIRLGIHWDDWVYRGFWHLSDAIVMGYPPIPMVNYPTLIAAKAEINTYIVPHHSPYLHFILSSLPRGGFSGGVAIHESGDALGVVTSSLVENEQPEQLGFFAVLSIEGIIKCLEENGLYPKLQKEYHDKKIGLSKTT